MTASLGNPYALGATGVPTTVRYDRLALGALFRPSSAALGAVSGFLVGPAGTMGDLTLLTDVLLRVDPFLAVVQGTHNTQQGQYLVPNTQQRDLAVPAKDASLFRRALLVVRVADSLEAGVASSPTTDGAWLELLPGALAASNPTLPALPANAFAAGEVTIPSTASGQPVTLTRYNPRTVARGGILPVVSTNTDAGVHDGQYRDHPLFGIQRWDAAAGAWRDPYIVRPVLLNPPSGWTHFTTAGGVGNGVFERLHYTVTGQTEVNIRGVVKSTGNLPTGVDLQWAPAGYLPAAIRPQQQVIRSFQTVQGQQSNPPMTRFDIRPDGSILYSPTTGFIAGALHWIDLRYSTLQP